MLPTGGAAHTHSPLGVHDFVKRASIGHVTARGHAELAPHTHRFATYEGFDGHANAVSVFRAAAHAGEGPETLAGANAGAPGEAPPPPPG